MLNITLLALGIASVLAGIFITLKEERTFITYKDADEIFRIINNFETKVNGSLKVIEDKTEESISLIKTSALDMGITAVTKSNQTESAEPISKLASKHLEIYNLHKKGLDSKEIAIHLKKGVGEVETIISLLNVERDNNNG